MPHAGDDLLMTRAVTNPLLNFSATGPAHTWTFTNLVAQDQNTTSYQSVSSTNLVYAVVYADVFFNSNRANHARAGVDIPFYQALPIEDPYTFLYRATNTYRKIGFGAELAALVQEHCFYHLETPIERVTGWDTPYPHAQEWHYFAGPARVAAAFKRAMEA